MVLQNQALFTNVCMPLTSWRHRMLHEHSSSSQPQHDHCAPHLTGTAAPKPVSYPGQEAVKSLGS